MDPVTHALTGIGLYHLQKKNMVQNDPGSDDNESKVINRGLFWAIFLGAVGPDVDWVFSLLGPFEYFKNHRGISHSIFGIVLLSLVVAIVLNKVFPAAGKKRLFYGALLGTVSHVTFDLLTTYSTMAFWPFTERWFSLSVLSIIDLFIIILYIAGLMLTRRNKEAARRVWTGVFSILIFYIVLRYGIHWTLEKRVAHDLGLSGTDRVLIIPDIIGINRWNFLTDEGESFQSGTVYLFPNRVNIEKTVKNHPVDKFVKGALATEEGKVLAAFSPFVLIESRLEEELTVVRLTDLRFNFAHHVLGVEVFLNADGVVKETRFRNFE